MIKLKNNKRTEKIHRSKYSKDTWKILKKIKWTVLSAMFQGDVEKEEKDSEKTKGFFRSSITSIGGGYNFFGKPKSK